MRRVSIRWRLTLWYGAVQALLLAGFGLSVYWMLAAALVSQADAEIHEELAELNSQIKTTANQDALANQLHAFFTVHPNYDFQVSSESEATIASRGEQTHILLNTVVLRKSSDVWLETKFVEGLGRYRIGTRTVSGRNGPLQIAMAIPLEPYERLLGQFLGVLFTAGPAILIIAIAGGYFMARKALAPVDDLRSAAERITAQHLDERIDVPNPDDELGRLAQTFNRMLERLDWSFQELRVFTADAAHELRTPLAVLRTGLDVALRTDRSPERYREVLREAVADVERLCELAERLLLLAHEDAGLSATLKQPMRLDQSLSAAIEQMRTAAEQQGLTIVSNELPPITFLGDADRLRQVWINLLDNAIHYTPSGGRLLIRAESFDQEVRVVIEDSGIGIPAVERSRVFDRFYRVDPSRNTATGGVGLGLAICKAIITSHGGEIRIEPAEKQGTRVIVSLPRSSVPMENPPREDFLMENQQ